MTNIAETLVKVTMTWTLAPHLAPQQFAKVTSPTEIKKWLIDMFSKKKKKVMSEVW